MVRRMLLILALFSLAVKAQEGVFIWDKDIPDPVPKTNAMLDMSGTKTKGFLGPKVALVHPRQASPFDSSKIVDGTIVYNTIDSTIPDDITLRKGYYVWKEGRWEPFSSSGVARRFISDEIDVSTLGYFPMGKASEAPLYLPQLDWDEGTATGSGDWLPVTEAKPVMGKKIRCFPDDDTYQGEPDRPLPPANGHKYCIYRIGFKPDSRPIPLSFGIPWREAFLHAKNMGGYLPTITTKEEWEYIKKVVLDLRFDTEYPDDPTYGGANIWIGYNKVQYPGTYSSIDRLTNFQEFIWITGEKSQIDWASASDTTTDFGKNYGTAQIEAFFAAGEPNNLGGVEGCTHIWNKDKPGSGPNRFWNDQACSSRDVGNGSMGKFDALLVEFQE